MNLSYNYLVIYSFLILIIQAVAGERFVDFRSDTEVKAPAATSDDVFSLSSVNNNNTSGASKAIPINNPNNSNALNTNSGSVVNSGSYINNQSSSLMSTSGIASYGNNTTNPNRSSRNLTSTSVPSTPTKLKSTSSFHIAPASYELWEKCASSRTGTSLALCAGSYYKQQAIGPLSATNSDHNNTSNVNSYNSASNSNSAGSKAPLAPLVLTWRGSEPLDKLHLSLRVSVIMSLWVVCFGL